MLTQVEKTTKRGALCSSRLTKYYSGDQIKLRWAGYVARIGERSGAYTVLVWRPQGRNHLEDQSVDGSII
jgi:hypothetical protein